MRSRFCAYARGKSDYIISTTDPHGPAYEADLLQWRSSIRVFSACTTFVGLDIVQSHAEGSDAWVTFRAMLRQGNRDVSFAERSTFVRRAKRWLYVAGQTAKR